MESNAFAEFWRQLPPGGKIHPADKPILDSEQHSLETKSMPAFGAGPLATAPVALCYGRIWRGKRLVLPSTPTWEIHFGNPGSDVIWGMSAES